jgi:hypothetical protein
LFDVTGIINLRYNFIYTQKKEDPKIPF